MLYNRNSFIVFLKSRAQTLALLNSINTKVSFLFYHLSESFPGVPLSLAAITFQNDRYKITKAVRDIFHKLKIYFMFDTSLRDDW